MAMLKADRSRFKHPDGCSYCLERGEHPDGGGPCPKCGGTKFEPGTEAHRIAARRWRWWQTCESLGVDPR